MDNALILEAPPTMFDELATILDANDFCHSLLSSDSITRGVRRKDSASYKVTSGGVSVELWLERRFGNPTVVISIFPAQKSSLPKDLPSAELADRIVKLLVAHGANAEPVLNSGTGSERQSRF